VSKCSSSPSRDSWLSAQQELIGELRARGKEVAARTLERSLSEVQAALSKGDTREVAQLAYTLGCLDWYFALDHAYFLPLAKVRVKERVLQEARNRGRSKAREDRRRKVRDRYRQLQQAHPRKKKQAVVEMLACEFQCCPRSIYAYLSDGKAE
jgi:hypothetical protein